MNFVLRATTLGAASLACLTMLSSPLFALTTISAHRAVYELELESAKSRSGVKNMTGRMALEITGSSCEGWRVNFRLVNDFQLALGKRRLLDSRSTAWESGDGEKLSYAEHEYIDNKPNQNTRLNASRLDHKVTQKEPKKLVFKLPAGAIFPVAHQILLINKAKAGELRDKSIVYDGSDRQNVYEAITFIGKKKPQTKAPSGLQGGGETLMNGQNAWPVTVSYFPIKNKIAKDTPSQQVSFTMYENGVAGDLKIDYGDWAIKGKLTYLKKLTQPACNK